VSSRSRTVPSIPCWNAGDAKHATRINDGQVYAQFTPPRVSSRRRCELDSQRLQTVADRIFENGPRSEQYCPIPIGERSLYRQETLHTSQPLDLSELISHYLPSRSLRSSNTNLLLLSHFADWFILTLTRSLSQVKVTNHTSTSQAKTKLTVAKCTCSRVHRWRPQFNDIEIITKQCFNSPSILHKNLV